jgi:DNA-binding beta-propeller fold protein YncE
LADRNNHRIRSLNIETKATSYITGAGEINAFYSDNGYQEGGPCPDTFEGGVEGCAYFNRPTGIALSPDEKTLYIAEGSNNRIRGVDIRTGITFHIAGTGEAGYVNGFGPWTAWNGPFTIAASDDGRTLYVVDKYNHSIREINIETKNVVTLVNSRGLPGDYSGYAPDSLLHIPEYIELGENGDIYITEAGGLRVKAVNISTRQVRLISGSGSRGLYSGSKEATRWSSPKGMARRGDWLFVADFYSDLIKLVNLK